MITETQSRSMMLATSPLWACYDAVPLLDAPLSLLLPLATVQAALEKAGKY
jgi:hypothetical protein